MSNSDIPAASSVSISESTMTNDSIVLITRLRNFITAHVPSHTLDSFQDFLLPDAIHDNLNPSLSSLQPSISKLDQKWLMNECSLHALNFSSSLSANDLYSQIIRILSSKIPLDSLQNSLVDLLGFENLQFIENLVSNKQFIIDSINHELPQNTQFQIFSQKDETTNRIKDKSRQQYGTQVTVNSLSEKISAKKARKYAKKYGKAIDDSLNFTDIEHQESLNTTALLNLDGDYLRTLREHELITERLHILNPSTDAVKYPHVYQSGSGGSVLSMFGTKYALPAGTEKQEMKDYDQITIPISKKPVFVSNERQILIKDLDKLSQKAFQGYNSLNRVQSIVFPIAYETNENMLVCAPTGAGKTDIAMLTILRCLNQHLVDGQISKDQFKIIYVAPMKALATEITRKFSSRLAHLGIVVRELTGDMQLTKSEIASSQMLVVTPEKFDVVGRKSMGDAELTQKVRLLIIDEVHLLNDDRGSVIESIVARTLRLVESSQTMIRIVGLSATLPNYIDVASFLVVNPYQGLFYFDSSFRPVPLEQHFVGVKGKVGTAIMQNRMNSVCYEKISDLIKQKRQIMIFVHSRKDTVKTAQAMYQEASDCNELECFSTKDDPQYTFHLKEVMKSKNKELKELFQLGFGIHHAGMARVDRLLTEKLFEKGMIKVLCCTATLAWGVNLPAFAVIIKGTQVYDATKGSFVDLSVLDVLQIFGRAGRPQYEDRGVGFILTSHDKLNHYVSAVTQQFPIESNFTKNLTDNLNAEISLGTVTNIDEAIRWLSYTYLYVRMRKNPFHYGLTFKDIENDSSLFTRRRDLIMSAAKVLHQAQMIILDENTEYLTPKDLGRTASSFYINTKTIEIYNTMMRPRMTEADVLSMLSMSSEFENIKVREEEVTELKKLEKGGCLCDIKGGIDTNYGKTNILLQNYISRSNVDDFTLASDTWYVAQNSARLLRGLFQISMSRNYGPTSSVLLSLCKSVDKKMWSFDHPLMQFDLPSDIQTKLYDIPRNITMDSIREMDHKEIGQLFRNMKKGPIIQKAAQNFPMLKLDAEVAPITRTVLRISLSITCDFSWNDKIHGYAEPFWIWVEDSENIEIIYSEYFMMTKKQHRAIQKIEFTIPLPETNSTVDMLPTQIYIRAISDRWIGSENIHPVSFKHLILPCMERIGFTDLLDLRPLPIEALKNPIYEEICKKRFKYFNPVQTQIFHTLYYTKHNVLLGAPTGSGKTVAAELALWAAFRDFPKSKVVYIAPMKALVKERVKDWTNRVITPMGKKLVELTGDVTPDLRTIENADIIITTPEKWDGISRSWRSRSYVKSVSLIIIDEIHLLGGERGPILEVIVSRMNYIGVQTGNPIRIVGLSTALANANDLADWLGIQNVGLFNFRHSVRPVSLDIYIDGFPGTHYCPRMMSMNKPAYKAIMTHSPDKPVIIFVSSRRQTRLTAQDLISLCANDDIPRRFLKVSDEDIESLLDQVHDPALRHSLSFGIGLHHAGLVEKDRQLVEELFVNEKIQILVATSTLAWGVNYPAHMVIVKGTEFFDAKRKGYVDYPITDVLQMMGRAGRIQYSDSGVAKIFVHDIKKDFYKKFLHEPFPVESSLHKFLSDHINAEIVTGSIHSKGDAVDYLTWTYFYRRLSVNPTYYGAYDMSSKSISEFLSRLVDNTISQLELASCIKVISDSEIESTELGFIASYYYLNCNTIKLLNDNLLKDYLFIGTSKNQREDGDFCSLLRILCDVCEYDELPVRHNEDIMNKELEAQLPVELKEVFDSTYGQIIRHSDYDDPHSKAFLLIQAHLDRIEKLPCSDYVTDTNSVLDQAIRILQAMIDVCEYKRYLNTALGVMHVMQCIKQGRWPTDSSLLCLPFVEPDMLEFFSFKSSKIDSISKLQALSKNQVQGILERIPRLSKRQSQEICSVIDYLPKYKVQVLIPGSTMNEGAWLIDTSNKYEIKIKIKRIGSSRENCKIHCPKFPKAQFEGGWVLLGNLNNELLGLKRFSPQTCSDITVTFKCVADVNIGIAEYVIHIVNDGYIGLDEQIPFRLLIQ